MDQQIVNAIFTGSIYALFAVGYTLVFGILDILNLAHSAVFMFGAALTYSLVVNHGQSFWIACVLGIIASAALGLVIEYVCLRPLRRRQAPPIAALISTIGLALVIVAAVEQGKQGGLFAWLWVDGANSVAFPRGTIPNPIWHVGDLTLEATKVVIIPISIALMLVLGYVMRYTQVGRGLRGVLGLATRHDAIEVSQGCKAGDDRDNQRQADCREGSLLDVDRHREHIRCGKDRRFHVVESGS